MSVFAEQHATRLAGVPFARKLLKAVDLWELGRIIRDVLRGDGDSAARGLP